MCLCRQFFLGDGCELKIGIDTHRTEWLAMRYSFCVLGWLGVGYCLLGLVLSLLEKRKAILRHVTFGFLLLANLSLALWYSLDPWSLEGLFGQNPSRFTRILLAVIPRPVLLTCLGLSIFHWIYISSGKMGIDRSFLTVGRTGVGFAIGTTVAWGAALILFIGPNNLAPDNRETQALLLSIAYWVMNGEEILYGLLMSVYGFRILRVLQMHSSGRKAQNQRTMRIITTMIVGVGLIAILDTIVVRFQLTDVSFKSDPKAFIAISFFFVFNMWALAALLAVVLFIPLIKRFKIRSKGSTTSPSGTKTGNELKAKFTDSGTSVENRSYSEV